MTANDIAAATSGIAARTVRAHLVRLVNLGLVDQAEVFPAHRYRLSDKAEKRNKAYLLRLLGAFDVFGMPVPQCLRTGASVLASL